MKWLRRIYIAMVLGFLYIPLAVMVVYSFNASRFSMDWKGFSGEWYLQLWNNTGLLTAALNSLVVAVVSATLSTVLGTLIAFTLTRWRFPSRRVIGATLFVMMMSPDIVIAISLLVLFMLLGLPLGFGTLVLAHVTLCLPFVAIVVQGKLHGFDPVFIEAARDLGAGDFAVFRYIVVPLVTPAVLAGWLLSFTLSLDDVVISFFTTGPTFEVLPLRIYSMVRLGFKPEINALCTIMMAITSLAVIIAYRVFKEEK